jgi:hypothetical protein
MKKLDEAACLERFSQLLGSRKDREEWLSSEENHEQQSGFALHPF